MLEAHHLLRGVAGVVEIVGAGGVRRGADALRAVPGDEGRGGVGPHPVVEVRDLVVAVEHRAVGGRDDVRERALGQIQLHVEARLQPVGQREPHRLEPRRRARAGEVEVRVARRREAAALERPHVEGLTAQIAQRGRHRGGVGERELPQRAHHRREVARDGHQAAARVEHHLHLVAEHLRAVAALREGDDDGSTVVPLMEAGELRRRHLRVREPVERRVLRQVAPRGLLRLEPLVEEGPPLGGARRPEELGHPEAGLHRAHHAVSQPRAALRRERLHLEHRAPLRLRQERVVLRRRRPPRGGRQQQHGRKHWLHHVSALRWQKTAARVATIFRQINPTLSNFNMLHARKLAL